jgi:Ca2+-binding RTX toxin-like protein
MPARLAVCLSSTVRASHRHHVATVAAVCAAAAALPLLPAVAGAWGPPRSGGLGAQTMRGGPGADYLRGAEGPDDVRGNGGADLLTGDTGPDSVRGGAGSDTISGAAGIDVLSGAAGIDVLSGGPGNDIITGGFGADAIRGGPGADALAGDNDTDTLFGDEGDDVLHGGSGADQLDGGDGDDRIFSDTGADAISGGPGRDTLVIDGSAFVRASCGPGRDTLYVVVAADATADYAGRGILATWAGDCEDVKVTDSLADPNKGMTYLAPDGGGARTGGARDDILLGGPGADALRGGDGRDVLWGLRQPGVQSVAADVLDGGDGDDTVYGGPGPQTISGGDGDDFLEGGIGDGKISGGRGDDTIRLRGAGLTNVDAGAGNDTIHARGTARARIRCGSGRDVAYADGGDQVARDCERRVGIAVRRARPRATYADALGATPGLVHWWRLGENPDAGAYRFNEISDAVGGAKGSWSAGRVGVPGVVDDGDTAWESFDPQYAGHLSLGIPTTILHGRFTFEAWFRADDLGGTPRAMLTDTTSGSVDGVVLVREIDGSLRASIASSTDGGLILMRTPALNLTPASWHHIALTRADDRVAIYVDGNLSAETPATPITIDAVSYGIGVGLSYGNYRDWLGAIDEIALYDRPLDGATLFAHAHAGDDGGAPVARVEPPLAVVLPNTAVLNLASDRAGSSFRCARDEIEVYGPCKPQTPLFGLPDGDHELRVIATSRTGVVQTAPTVVRFRLDARIPGTLLVLRLSPDGDGRAIASFGSEGASHFECRGHRGYLPGNWVACTPPIDLERNAHFAVRAVDDAGNRDPYPASVYVPPSGQGVTGAWALQTFAGARAEALISHEPGVGLAGLGLQCRVDARDWAACSKTLRLPILDAGSHSLQVRQTVAGETALTAPISWTVGPGSGQTAIVGLQAPLVLERNRSLLRRAPHVRFALNAPAAIELEVLRRGRPVIAVRTAGRSGSNVLEIPAAKLYALGTGRYTVRVAARAGSGARTVQQLALAIVPPLR